MTTVNGRFVWYDLITTDLAAARTFYTEVIGWTLTNFGGGEYTMWTAGGQMVGGIGPLPEEAKKAGIPPHWLAHIKVEDVDATVKKAQELGGHVHVPGTDIPNVGRFAVVADPQGAVFSVFKPQNQMEDEPKGPGTFGWAELNTTDYESAWKFYEALLGWKPTMAMDMGPGFGTYFMFGLSPDDPEKSMGGMSNAATMMNAPAHWMYYITVADLEGTLARVTEKGGRVLNGPMDVPGGDRIAQCMDPQGGFFAVYARGKQ